MFHSAALADLSCRRAVQSESRGFSANDSLLSVNHTHPELNEKGRFCRKGTRTRGKTMSKSASTYCVKPSETTVPFDGHLRYCLWG